MLINKMVSTSYAIVLELKKGFLTNRKDGFLTNNCSSIHELPVLGDDENKREWCGNQRGEFTIANAVEIIRKKFPVLKVWKKSARPSIASNG